MTMTQVEIEYCVPCGLLPDAQEASTALLREFGRDLDAVTLRTGHGGVFKVAVDGDLVFDKAEDGYDVEEIVDRVETRVDGG